MYQKNVQSQCQEESGVKGAGSRIEWDKNKKLRMGNYFLTVMRCRPGEKYKVNIKNPAQRKYMYMYIKL